MPTIQDLKQQVEIYTSQHDEVKDKALSAITLQTWNEMFHSIISSCSLENNFTLEKLPRCYTKGLSCSHIFHIDLDKIVSNTIRLTLLEQTKFTDNLSQRSFIKVKSFISKIIKQNPLWDIGLQFLTMQTNFNQIYMNFKDSAEKFTKCCICPYSYMFGECNKQMSIDNLPQFIKCKSNVFTDPMEFIIHLESSKEDYYYRIVMRVVQNLYSSLLAKFTTVDSSSSKKTFYSVHKGSVSLPSYQNTGADYGIFEVKT